jgi:arsenite oxidase small subunit
MALSRREFLALGVASGAVAAAGVVVPVALLTREDEAPPTTTTPESPPTTTSPPDPETIPAVVTLYPRVKVASLRDLSPHSVVDFSYPTEGSPASLFRLDRPAAGGVGEAQEIVAFSTFCTHMGCPLAGQYNPEHAVLGPCGCHFTTFDLTLRGQVVIGQATEDLPQIILDIEGDDVFAVGTMGIVYGFQDNLADAVVVEGL